MTERLDVQGLWWLPDTPDHKVHGWFTYDPDDGGTLRLAGSLRPANWIENHLRDGSMQRYVGTRPEADRLYPHIHGQSGPHEYHLGDAFQVSLQQRLCREEDCAERVHVNWLIAGAWFEGATTPQLDRASVEFQHATSWVDNDALAIDADSVPEGLFAIAQATQKQTLRAQIGEGLQLGLVQSLFTSGDHRHNATLNQRILVVIEAASMQPLRSFTDRVSDFQDLLTIASGKVANIEQFQLRRDDVPQRTLTGHSIGHWKKDLRYYTRWSNRDEHAERLSPYEMLFSFDDLGGIAGVGRWMQVADRYRSELSRVMATRYSSSMFVEDRVAHCVAALEGFDRTRHSGKDDGTHLSDRIRRCAQYAGAPFVELLGGEPIELWTGRAKDRRHALGHHLDSFRENTSLVEHELGDQLYWLAVLCFLREAEAPDRVFERLSDNSTFRWVTQRAAQRQE